MATCMLSSKMSPIIRLLLKEQSYSSTTICNGVTEISRRGYSTDGDALQPAAEDSNAATADRWSTTPVWSWTGRCERTRIIKPWFRPWIKCTKPYEVTATSFGSRKTLSLSANYLVLVGIYLR